MVRNERLAECCRVHQLGDGSLARREYLEEAQARFVAKCAESECGHGANMIGDVRHRSNINNYLYFASIDAIMPARQTTTG